MISQFKNNFYIRKDNDNLLWSGISINTIEDKYSSYKLSCYISKQKSGSWHPKSIEFIVLDQNNNMYSLLNTTISKLYNPKAKDRDIMYKVSLSKVDDEYSSVETTNIYLNELLIKNIIDELKTKSEQSFGIKITI